MITPGHTDKEAPVTSASSSEDGAGIIRSGRPGGWTRVRILWRQVINSIALTGYQDANGFHHGEMSAMASDSRK